MSDDISPSAYTINLLTLTLNEERALADDLAADLDHLESELRKLEGVLPVIFPRSSALARYREARGR